MVAVMGKKVLFIDDEELVHRIVPVILKSLGYDVTSQLNADDGYTCFLNSDFDLVITDQTMPGISGIELISKLRAESYSIPIILCSGDNVDISQFEDVETIQKPISAFELSQVVQSII